MRGGAAVGTDFPLTGESSKEARPQWQIGRQSAAPSEQAALLEDQSLSPDVKRSGIENVPECGKIARNGPFFGLSDGEIPR